MRNWLRFDSARWTARSALVAAAVSLMALVAAAPSMAGAPVKERTPDPLDTNVPYVAWRGEQIRLVKCQRNVRFDRMREALVARSLAFGDVLKADFLVEDWSGPNPDRAKPQIEPGTVDFFWTRDDGLCVKADVVSQKAGIAPVKLLVTFDPSIDVRGVALVDGPVDGIGSLADLFTRSEILFKHQYLAMWLNLGTPTLTEEPGTKTSPVGDEGGDGNFDAGNPCNGRVDDLSAKKDPYCEEDGRVKVVLKGTLPLLGNYDELGLGSSVTLPDAWPALAGVLARDVNPNNTDASNRWDIHDDTTTAEGHPSDSPCDDKKLEPSPKDTIEAVDNCEGGYDFSRWYTNHSGYGPIPGFSLSLTRNYTIGPFDPMFPDETFLPDGKLTADDAPMPAARIDVSIAANSGKKGDLSGVGSLERVSKQDIYSRDGSGRPSEHNLYAPFYSAFIPATGDGSWLIQRCDDEKVIVVGKPCGAAGPVSGIDGPAQGNNFPGFLVGDGKVGGPEDYYSGDNRDRDGLYDFWDIAHVFRTAGDEKTACLDRYIDPNDDNLRDPKRIALFRDNPGGAQSVAVYTDEHGEAQVAFRPGMDFYFDAMTHQLDGSTVGVVDENGACDLQGVDVLGTASITAVARYPYQPVTDPDKAAKNSLDKVVHSLFDKSLYYRMKENGPKEIRVVQAHAQNIDGSPYEDETVCFTGDYKVEYMFAAPGFRNVRDPRGGEKRTCVKTDDYGNARVEVNNSNGDVVNVMAEFADELIWRDIHVDFSKTPSTGGTPPPDPKVPPKKTGEGVTAPSSSAINQALTDAGLSRVAVKKSKVNRYRVVAQLHNPLRGHRYLTVRVSGASKTAKVKITLVGSKGKKLRTITRTLPTNKRIRINITIRRSVKSVRVAAVQ